MKIKKIEWRNVASYGNKIQKCEGTGVESGTVDYVYAVPLLHGMGGNRNGLPFRFSV